MYQHILIPTDGSELSGRAVQQGVLLARELHAKVTGIKVTLSWKTFSRGELFGSIGKKFTEDQYNKEAAIIADNDLTVLSNAAKRANVEYNLLHVKDDYPYQAILRAVQTENCDLIFMASHGHRGVEGVLLGSETVKVLTHSKIPVHVYRE